MMHITCVQNHCVQYACQSTCRYQLTHSKSYSLFLKVRYIRNELLALQEVWWD